MKQLSLIFFFFIYVTNGIQAQESDQNNEIIFVVDMAVINDKSDVEVADFSAFYTSAIKDNETHTLGWGFYESNGKVVLIERYTNSKAMMKHAKNISLEGPMQNHFVKFMDHFRIQKIDVYGNISEELKVLLESFKLPFIYHKPFASFSRN